MALAVARLTSGSQTTSNPSTTASINPTSGSLTLAWLAYAVEGGGTSSNTDTITPSGARGTWTQLRIAASSEFSNMGRRGIVLWAGTGSVTNEAVTITATCGSGTWTETAWVFDEWTGQDTGTPYDTAQANGDSSTSGEITSDLGTPGTGDRVTAAWFSETDETISATGLTATGSQLTGCSDVRTMHVFYDASDPQDETPAASWTTSGTWGAIGLIINAAAGGSVIKPAMHLQRLMRA
jgi:hypothetical protein